jgi:regulator of replication initiation timing
MFEATPPAVVHATNWLDIVIAVGGSGGIMGLIRWLDRHYFQHKQASYRDREADDREAQALRQEATDLRKEMGDRIDDLENKVDELTSQLDDYRKKYWALYEENAKTRLALERMEVENKDVLERCQKMAVKLDQLRQVNDDLEHKLAELKSR